MSSEVDGRTQLNEYLEKPLEVSTGELSTQGGLSATTLSTGGLSGKFLIKDNGEIVIVDKGVERVRIDKSGITVNDGVNDRVKIGNIS